MTFVGRGGGPVLAALLAGGLLVGSLLAACSTVSRTSPASATSARMTIAANPSVAASASTTTATTAPGDVPVAGQGTAAASQRRTFVPTGIRLLSRDAATAAVDRVDTGPDGNLELPVDPGVTGWWVSGALAGEVYGSVVLAGHIDSRERGIGFFAKLLDAAPGDRVELTGAGLRQVYVVRSNREVAKGVLSAGTDVFDRSVPGRLVLLTCTGRFDPATRHYDHNLVVTAEPLGVPTSA